MSSAIEELRRECGGDPLRPDAEYPAFPRDQINHAYDRLEEALNESIAAEKKLFTSPGWKDITSGNRPPDADERSLMRDSAFSTLRWEVLLSRCQFLTEANLKVRRGDWTIAQAQYLYQRLEPAGFAMAADAGKLVDTWCSRFQNKNRAGELQREFDERMRPYESEREEVLGKWMERFKAMHGSKPIYQVDNGV